MFMRLQESWNLVLGLACQPREGLPTPYEWHSCRRED